MNFRLYFKVLGGHTHVRLFSSQNPNGTFGKNGDLIFRNHEWKEFLDNIKNMEILPEPEKNEMRT